MRRKHILTNFFRFLLRLVWLLRLLWGLLLLLLLSLPVAMEYVMLFRAFLLHFEHVTVVNSRAQDVRKLFQA